MNIYTKVIPHNEQRYETCGDWWFDENGDLQIRVSFMNNWKFESLIAIHEQSEALECKSKGIDEKDVMAFDLKFEEMRKAYPDFIGDDEPGNHHKAPYFQQHLNATQTERFMANLLEVQWDKYEEQVNALPEIINNKA